MQKPLILGVAVVAVAVCAAHLCPPEPERVAEADSPAFGCLLREAILELEHGTWEVTSATVGVANAGGPPSLSDSVAGSFVAEAIRLPTMLWADCPIAITVDICPITTDPADCVPVVGPVNLRAGGLEPDSSTGVVVGELEARPMPTIFQDDCPHAISVDICVVTTDPAECHPAYDFYSELVDSEDAISTMPEVLLEEDTGTDRTTWGGVKRMFSE